MTKPNPTRSAVGLLAWSTADSPRVRASGTGPSCPVRHLAHAKLNLSLAVGSRRPDGYHELDSLMAPLELADELAAVDSSGGLSLELAGPCCINVPTDATNLAWRAADLLAEQSGHAADVAIQIVKHIPAGGGLAGGSADAAAALLACNRLWDLNWTFEQLVPLAAALGSDVPFCLSGGPARVSGRGEVVAPLAAPLPRLWALLIYPGLHVATGAVYARLDAMRADGAAPQTRRHRLAGLELLNDLEAAALAECPPLGQLYRQLDQSLGVPRLMVAGSGSTLFALFEDMAEATLWEDRIHVHLGCSTGVLAVRRGPVEQTRRDNKE